MPHVEAIIRIFALHMAKAKKSYGQHFLINEPVAQRIADGLTMTDTVKNVLEIGPGKGVLTKYLLRKDINLKVVEADRDMVAYLEEHFPELHGRIIFLDFLKLNMYKVFDGEPFLLIGNYPYNISSQIIFKMLKARDLIPEMVGMFQKEVSDRIIAPHGNKTYGILSVLTQAYYAGRTIVKVQPGSFNPPPKVQSSVIHLVRKPEQELPCSERMLRIVVKQGFSQRRKMLRNTLKSLADEQVIADNEVFTKRPEQLSLQEFYELTSLIEKNNDES